MSETQAGAKESYNIKETQGKAYASVNPKFVAEVSCFILALVTVTCTTVGISPTILLAGYLFLCLCYWQDVAH
jgi:hypothetical protein